MKKNSLNSFSLDIFTAALIIYFVAAFIVIPKLTKQVVIYDKDSIPKVARKGNGIPGDPINMVIVGEKAQLIAAFKDASWSVAAKMEITTLSLEVGSVLIRHKYQSAPVSSLYLWGHQQDIAFEQLAGKSPRHRNHVRFWVYSKKSPDGRSIWIGSATYDKGVGFSHRSGAITHHIAPDVDDERDKIVNDLQNVKWVDTVKYERGVNPTFAGRNGEGDWYYTDGERAVVTLLKR